jgi:hypothetical protein
MIKIKSKMRKTMQSRGYRRAMRRMKKLRPKSLRKRRIFKLRKMRKQESRRW